MELADYNNSIVDLNSEDHFNQLVKQVVKDFKDEEFEERVAGIGVSQQSILQKEVGLFLSAICSRSITEFSQLMYVVDMPEKILAPFLSSGERSWDDFTYQVLKREYLKVLIRKKYSD